MSDDPEDTIAVLGNLSTIDQAHAISRLQSAVLDSFY
jgi:hypothetical protein